VILERIAAYPRWSSTGHANRLICRDVYDMTFDASAYVLIYDIADD